MVTYLMSSFWKNFPIKKTLNLIILETSKKSVCFVTFFSEKLFSKIEAEEEKMEVGPSNETKIRTKQEMTNKNYKFTQTAI